MTHVLEYGTALATTWAGSSARWPELWAIHSTRAPPPLPFTMGWRPRRRCSISGPSSLASVIERWGRGQGIPNQELPLFLQLVASRVGEPLGRLDLTRIAAQLTTPDGMIVHDRDDKEIPVDDALALAAASPGSTTLITEHFGHRRIMIAPRVVRREVVGFLNNCGVLNARTGRDNRRTRLHI